MGAVEAGDVTAPIQGCGRQLSDGFISCRKTEGDASNDFLYFVGPPAQCKGDGACVTFKIFYPDGSPSYGGEIPKGQTRVAIPWNYLLKRDTFELGDRGFWGFSYTIRFMDSDGLERTTYMQGEIYMRVVRKQYVSLHDIPQDPNFAWEWVESQTEVKVTTGGRVYMGKLQ